MAAMAARGRTRRVAVLHGSLGGASPSVSRRSVGVRGAARQSRRGLSRHGATWEAWYSPAVQGVARRGSRGTLWRVTSSRNGSEQGSCGMERLVGLGCRARQGLSQPGSRG